MASLQKTKNRRPRRICRKGTKYENAALSEKVPFLALWSGVFTAKSVFFDIAHAAQFWSISGQKAKIGSFLGPFFGRGVRLPKMGEKRAKMAKFRFFRKNPKIPVFGSRAYPGQGLTPPFFDQKRAKKPVKMPKK